MLSASQIQEKGNPITINGKLTNIWNRVWKTKVKQTIAKASLVLSDDPDTIQKINTIKAQFGIK